MNSLLLAELKFSGYKYHNKHMNDNLKEILQQMLFMSDQQVLSDDFKKINFKKNGWWRKYTWTAKTEERFIEGLTESLKKDWKGLVPNKPGTRNLRKKIAEEFVFNYGCVVRELRSSDFMYTVSWSQLDEQMTKKEREDFNKWMFGKTTSTHGVYRHDLERYLKGLPCID